MVNKHRLDKQAEMSAFVEGKEQSHLDGRILYDPVVEWNDSFTVSEMTDGDKYIKLSRVNHLIIENEMLRQSLYANQNLYYNRVISSINAMIGQSTSGIIKTVAAMSRLTQGAIKEPEIYTMIYSVLQRSVIVDFSRREPNESKLQYLWKIGALPIVSMITSSLYNVLLTFGMIDHKASAQFFNQLNATLNKKLQQKPNRIVMVPKIVKKP